MKIAGKVVVLILAVSSALVEPAAQASYCALPKGLDTLWEQSYRALNRINRAEGQQDDRNSASLARASLQYAVFAEHIGKLETARDNTALGACCRVVGSDRVARQLCARSEYVASGRKDARPFLTTLPRNRDELALFWRLDSITSPDTISMALGSRALGELARLLYEDNPEALERFLFMWSDADGAFAEDMSDSLAELVSDYPEIVIRRWQIMRPHRMRLTKLRDYFDTDSRELATRYRLLCKTTNRPCAEILDLLAYPTSTDRP